MEFLKSRSFIYGLMLFSFILFVFTYTYEIRFALFPDKEISKYHYKEIRNLSDKLAFYEDFYRENFNKERYEYVVYKLGTFYNRDTNEFKKITNKEFEDVYFLLSEIREIDSRKTKAQN